MTARSLPAALFVSAFLVVRADAQQPNGSRDAALSDAIARVREGQVIRVALMQSQWTGAYQRLAGDTLYFGPNQPVPMGIRFSAIDTLWVRSNHSRRVSDIGIVSGVLLGGLAGMYVIAGYADGPVRGISGEMWRYAGVGALAGGVAGGLLGAAIGAPLKRWKRIFPGNR